MEKRLTEDLNVVANSNLEIQLLDGDLNIIQKLDDEPNDVGGLTSAELKAKFDESGNIIKKYINETLIPAVLTDDAKEESRKQAEAARVTAEQGRVTAEEGRVSAESGRVSAEQARAEAEASRVSAENARETAEKARADETSGIVARATAQANAAESNALAAKSAQGLAESSEINASSSAQAAQSAASTASNAASSADQAATAASGSASQASAAATAAAGSAAGAETASKTAQSWAVGGTGTRPGEDTDNAKYWAQQAQAVVGGDFATKVEAQGYVTAHNQSTEAHADIRNALNGKEASGTATAAVTAHNKDSAAHADIRNALAGKETAGAAAAVQSNLTAHAGNTTVHVTAEQKTTWNGKAAGKHASQHGKDGTDPITPAAIGAASLGADGKVPANQLPEISSVKTYTATIGTTWVEDSNTGVKTQSVAIAGVTAQSTAMVDHVYTGSGTSEDYAAFVEAENQYLTCITNGYAETYDGGIKFTIFGDANTVSIPIVAEVS